MSTTEIQKKRTLAIKLTDLCLLIFQNKNRCGRRNFQHCNKENGKQKGSAPDMNGKREDLGYRNGNVCCGIYF